MIIIIHIVTYIPITIGQTLMIIIIHIVTYIPITIGQTLMIIIIYTCINNMLWTPSLKLVVDNQITGACLTEYHYQLYYYQLLSLIQCSLD